MTPQQMMMAAFRDELQKIAAPQPWHYDESGKLDQGGYLQDLLKEQGPEVTPRSRPTPGIAPNPKRMLPKKAPALGTLADVAGGSGGLLERVGRFVRPAAGIIR